MKPPIRSIATLLPAVAALWAGVLTLVPATAHAQTVAERECRAAISKAAARYTQRVFALVERCHRKHSAGVLLEPIDCNDLAQADAAGRRDKQKSKLAKAMGANSACASAPGVLAQFARCPSPAADADDGGASDGIDSYGELSVCLAALRDELIGQASERTLGAPERRLSPRARRCQQAIGKDFRRVLAAYSKERSRCQVERDLTASGLEYGCSDFDGDGRIAEAIDRMKLAIAHACDLDDDPTVAAVEEIDALGACGDTVEQLQTCAAGSVAAGVGAGLVASAYEMPAACRAGSLVRISNAGTGSHLTGSSFSGGWNGIGHDIDLTDRFRDAMRLDCDADCANCALSLDALAAEPDAYCRCTADLTRACDTIGADPGDCGTGNSACQCFLGPPVSVSAGGAPACISVRIDEGHGGTIDLGRGEWSNTLGLAAVLHLGTDLAQPCPVCANDPQPRDGVRGGTCTSGPRANQPCDVAAIQPTFGPSSYDCPPQSLTNISGAGLGLRIDMTTESLSLASTLPCDAPAAGLCPCRVCSNDTSLGCSDEATCAAAGAGTCTGGGGAGVRPNACTDGVCSDDGRCVNGPLDRYCDGQTYLNGRGYVACLSDLDCSLLGAGTCSLLDPRRCYPNPILTSGAAGFFGGRTGTVGCLGLTNSAVVNQATGLPGAIRVVLDFETEVRCASDPSIEFEPPTGANCPADPVAPTTTTTTLIPPLPCALSLPLCGGSCAAGLTCAPNGLLCACLP